MEVPTDRGRMDQIIFHNQKKYVIETKIWRSARYYAVWKKQLSAYLSTEGVTVGYYVVFDHREAPEPRTETETIDGLMIRSYVIPVVQERPSSVRVGKPLDSGLPLSHINLNPHSTVF